MKSNQISMKCTASGKVYLEFYALPGMHDEIAKVVSASLVVTLNRDDLASGLLEIGLSPAEIEMTTASITILNEISFYGKDL